MAGLSVVLVNRYLSMILQRFIVFIPEFLHCLFFLSEGNVMDVVMDCDGYVTARMSMGEGCDGCDGLF
jgi:hypothetical protein